MDILINNNRLPMIDGDFQLTDRLQLIKQHISVALNTMYADWLLNYQKGIDYDRDLKSGDMTFLDHDVKKQIDGVEGVVSIKNYTRKFDRKTLTVVIVAIVETIYGDLPIKEVINKC